jgi:hypothetical protein
MENFLTPTFLNNMEKRKEDKMLKALTVEFKTMFPSRTRVLGKENLNLFLSHQQQRARYYDYIYYDDLKRYAIIAFYLGTYFDDDELYPWVQNILKEEESFGVKVDSLMEKFQILSQETLGEAFSYFLEALEKLEKLSPRMIENFKKYENIVDTLKYIYPQRVEVIGEEILYKQLKTQKIELDKYEIHNALGAFTYLSIKFILGSYVLKDPLYAWVGKYVLKTYQNDEEKSRALFDKGMSRVRKEILEMKKIRGKGE